MKRKIISIILVIGLFLNNFSFSYGEEIQERYAPALVAVAPEIVSTIGAFIVASGGTIIGQKMLNDVTRHFYNENEDNWDSVVETFKSSVSVTKDGLVRIGSDFLNLLTTTFDKLTIKDTSTDTNISVSGSYYSIPVLGSLPPTGKGNKIVDGVGIKIFTTMSYGNILFEDELGTCEQIVLKRKDNNSYVTRVFNNRALDMQYFIYNKSIYSYFYNYSSKETFTVRECYLSNFDTISSVLDLPTGSISSNLKLESDNSILVGVPNTLDKFIDGTISYDNIYNPNYDIAVDGTVGVGSLPGVSNPSIEYGDNITIPSVNVGEGDIPGEGDIIIPEFPSFGDSLDFSPLYMTNIKDKFPFSLPWDFKNLINMFDVDPVAPKFEVPFLGNNITLDFSYFEEWATIIRFFISISFTATLIFISVKLKG